MKLSETNFLLRSILQVGWLHEGCHYIAACLVDLDVVSIGPIETNVETGAPWQMLIISLAPAWVGLVGTVGMIVLGLRAPTDPQRTIFGLFSSLGVSWLLACRYDLQDAWNILKQK